MTGEPEYVRSRGQADATLHITGRDVEEQDLALRFDAAIGTWKLLGERREWAVSEQRRKIIEALEDAGRAMKPKQLAEAAGLAHDVVKHLVRSMLAAGQIETDESGSYLIHRSPPSPIHPSPLHPQGEPEQVRGERVNGVKGEYDSLAEELGAKQASDADLELLDLAVQERFAAEWNRHVSELGDPNYGQET